MSSILPEEEYNELLDDELLDDEDDEEAEDEEEEELYPDTTWILNEDNKTIGALQDDPIACVAQSLKLALRTEQQEYEMYPIWYGSTLNEAIGDTVPHVYAEIEDAITECAEQDSRIDSVDDFEFENDMGNIIVRFTVSIGGEEMEMELEVDTNGSD